MIFPPTTKTFALPRGFACAGQPSKFAQTGSPRAHESAFTMIEIALSIAVVSFALVAILGVLPTGHQVQRDNREDTIINQDGTYLLEAIRNGLKGATDLSNYVDFVSIQRTGGATGTRRYANLTSAEIIGQLSTPKYDTTGKTTITNTVTAVIRAITGSAVDKPPAIPRDRDFVFHYQVTSEVIPATPAPTNGLAKAELQRALALGDNLHELRLTFRWPVLPPKPNDLTVRLGNSRRVFSTLVSGQIEVVTNKANRFFYFQPMVFH
ncbi:MAG: hypothetical protein HY043_03700 [Verrucomicrobia bacterium]|nr:hypothetical protein [Verrucomicrobiota bacterium]